MFGDLHFNKFENFNSKIGFNIKVHKEKQEEN